MPYYPEERDADCALEVLVRAVEFPGAARAEWAEMGSEYQQAGT